MGIFSKFQKHKGFIIKLEKEGTFSNPIPIAVVQETTANIGDRIISFWNDERDVKRLESKGNVYFSQPSEHIYSYAVKSGYITPRAVSLAGMVVEILERETDILFGTSSITKAYEVKFVSVFSSQLNEVAKKIQKYASLINRYTMDSYYSPQDILPYSSIATLAEQKKLKKKCHWYYFKKTIKK